MSDIEKKENREELNDEELDAVSGGLLQPLTPHTSPVTGGGLPSKMPVGSIPQTPAVKPIPVMPKVVKK